MIPLLLGTLVLVLGVRGIPLGEAERALVKQADCAEWYGLCTGVRR